MNEWIITLDTRLSPSNKSLLGTENSGGCRSASSKSNQNSKLKVDLVSAGLSYFTLCFALNYFVLPYVKTNDYGLLSHSFVFGLVTYAVYDFTCGAIFEKWDKKLMIIDTIWGGVLYMITTYLTNLIVKN